MKNLSGSMTISIDKFHADIEYDIFYDNMERPLQHEQHGIWIARNRVNRVIRLEIVNKIYRVMSPPLVADLASLIQR